jgi:hypothetical protein
MIVVDVFRARPAADRTPPALRLQQLVDLDLPDAVAPPQVVLPRPAVEAVAGGLATGVVAWLAVVPEAAAARGVPREVCERLRLTAVRASPMPSRDRDGHPNLSPGSRREPLRVADPGSLVEARLAVAPASPGTSRAHVKIVERFGLAAVTAPPDALPRSIRNGHIGYSPPFCT